jgi:uncharacterized repeat protein (TIGR01451 family)
MFAKESGFRASIVSNGLLRRMGVCAVLALFLAGAFSAGAVTITRTSGSTMQTDIPNGLSCTFVSYIVSNNTATVYSNVWIKADAFTGGAVSLGGGDNGLYPLDDLMPGQAKPVFFYLRATATTSQPQSHAIKLYEGYPDGGTLVANQTFSLTVSPAKENNSSKVSSVTYTPAQPTVGGTVLIKITGDAGNVSTRDVVNFTPAAFTNWNAAAFDLIDVTLVLTNKNLQARTISDYLELPAEYSVWAVGGITYTASYTFRALVETERNTPVSPITYATQGNSSSHTTTTGYGSFAPIQSPTNTTVLAKLADVTQVYTNETVTYTVRITNSGANDVELDRIVDTLPSGMTYVPGSSRFNGTAVLDPQISGSLLTWSEADRIPATSSRDFIFQARVSLAGYPTNRVVAYVGGDSTLIDTTLRTDDNVPGEVTVRTLLAPTAADDSFSVVEDGVLSVPAPGVLANDSDLNGFPIKVVGYTQPANGTVALNADGSFSYTPAPDYIGGDSFSYTLTNDNGRAATATVLLDVLPVNDAPSFTAGADQTVLMNAGAQTVIAWAAEISKGPANEAGQTLAFAVTNNNTALFSAQPAVSADGTLTYTAAPGLRGIATVTLSLQDDGGIANGGVDRSLERTFTIKVIAYSIGNWVFRDPDNDAQPDMDNLDEGGFTNVLLYVFAADAAGAPTGAVYGASITDENGYYRVDGLVAGTYVVVVDVMNSPALNGYRSVTGASSDTTASGERHDHGLDTPLDAGSVVPGGIASGPVTVGLGMQPVAEATGPGQGANGPSGDANDNLVIDFGFYPLYSLGNRVFDDANNNGIMDGGESGVASAAMKLFAVDSSGSPTGGVIGATSTDADGYYRFDDLSAGTYVVVVDLANSAPLTGYVSSVGASTDMALAGDLLDHGLDAPVSVGPVVNGIASAPVTVGLNDLLVPLGEAIGAGFGANGPNGDDGDNLVVDFGFTKTASVSGRAVEDINGNGLIEAGDNGGIANVTIHLLSANGALLRTVTTDGSGAYSFAGLPPGDYLIEVVALPGWVCTGDADGGSDLREAGALASGQDVTEVNFLGTRPGVIEGTVWNDLNADGVFDAAELVIGLGGVTVALETNGVAVATTTTMAGGKYLFENVLPGDYVIVQTDLAGWLSTADTDVDNDNRIAVSLSSGGQETGNDFLDYTHAVISGSVRVDVNGNGRVDVEDAAGLAGVTVRLLDAGEQEVGTTTTAVDGSFVFADLAPGSYTVVESDPAGYVSTSANQINVTATSGQQLGGYVFLDTQTGSLGDRVWEDLNGNGVQDAGEAGLSNVVVRLLNAEGTEVAVTQTDTNGVFLFSAQLPGAYVLDVAAPQGFEPTRYQIGEDRALDNDINPLTGFSDLILLTAGQTNRAADAGFVLPALVKGYVFLDNNDDLLRDTGDSSITNILVRLVSDGWVVASTNTDETGYYAFDNVMPGVVTVLVSRTEAVLLAVPESEDERRNRAVPDGEGVDAVIVRTVLSGEGMLEERPAETLNFGFAEYPLSTAIDISLHATAEGVTIQLWTVNEAGNGDIVIYAWIGNDWTEVGRVPGWQVVGENANTYTVAASGLVAGGAYYLKVVDETGNVHLSPMPVAVHALQVAAVRLDLQSVMLRFNTEYGRRYQVEVSTDLVTWRTEYESAPTEAGWTAYETAPFMAGPGGQTEVRVPRNSRSRAFFRIRRVE